jgi:hypothetical protein
MITLYRKKDCPRCIDIQGALEELLMPHRIVIVRSREDLPENLRGIVRLPAMEDEGHIYQGAEDVLAQLERLSAFKELWYRYQSDACYCDEDDE